MTRLQLELVPKSAHGVNLRAVAKRSQWRRMQELTVHLAGGRCEVCGAPPSLKHPLETHEVWGWDEERSLQQLLRLQALCKWCHLCKHSGMAERLGLTKPMHQHLMRVNGWDIGQVVMHTKLALKEWLRLSRISWHFEPDLAAIIADLEEQAASTAT